MFFIFTNCPSIFWPPVLVFYFCNVADFNLEFLAKTVYTSVVQLTWYQWAPSYAKPEGLSCFFTNCSAAGTKYSKRFDVCNIQFHGFEISRDLIIRRPLLYWVPPDYHFHSLVQVTPLPKQWVTAVLHQAIDLLTLSRPIMKAYDPVYLMMKALERWLAQGTLQMCITIICLFYDISHLTIWKWHKKVEKALQNHCLQQYLF